MNSSEFPPPEKRGAFRVIASGGAVRLASLPIGALCTGLTAYISVRYVGAEDYGYVNLVASLVLFIIFADFGLGAVVLNVASRIMPGDSPTDADLRTIWRVFVRITFIALALCAGTFVIATAGHWPDILGLPRNLAGANYATALALSIMFVAAPLYMGQRILVGLGHVGEMTLIAILGPVVTVIATWLLVTATVPPMYLSIAPAMGTLIANTIFAWRAFSHLGVGFRELRAANPVGIPERLAHSAISFFVLSIGWALATQSHRFILARFSTAQDLSSYSLMSQIFMPIQSVIFVGAVALWPAYKQSRDGARALWHSAFKTLTSIGLIVGIVFALFSGLVVNFISSGKISSSALLASSFGLLILVMSIHQASALFLTDESGLRFQAYCAVAFALVAVSASIALASRIGAAGPVLATSFALVFAMLLPSVFRVRRVIS